MRILVCNWKDGAHPRAGGAEVWTHGIASAWAADGHDVVLATSTARGLAARAEIDGVEIWRGGDYRVGVRAHARRVYHEHGGRFDLVVDEINTRPFAAPQWARESRVVAFVHQLAREVWFRETPFPLALAGRHVLEPQWLRPYRSVRVGALSESTASSLRAIGFTNVFVPPVAADLAPTAAARTPKNQAPTFVFAGRLCAMKRPLDVIRAFRLAQLLAPEAELHIIGTGPEEAAVRRAAGTGVTVHGWVTRSERDELMARAHALVATSVREGWGLVVSEAAAVGTGTIAYAVPGLIDSVHATGGRLVPPTVDDLARALTLVALDPMANAPRPIATGTRPFAEVARTILAEAEVSVHA